MDNALPLQVISRFVEAKRTRNANSTIPGEEVMKIVSRLRTFVLILVFGICFTPAAPAKSAAENWVATWGCAPQSDDKPNPNDVFQGMSDTTLRQVVHVSLGGRQVRLRISNVFGTAPLKVGAVHIAFPGHESGIDAATDRTVTFGEAHSIVVPAGALILSDPVSIDIKPLSDVAITIYIKSQSGPVTRHSLAMATTYRVSGNEVSKAILHDSAKSTTWYFLTGIDVLTDEKSAAIVTLGDSITDGAKSTLDTNRRWPDELAGRLAADSDTRHFSVLNEGISGNRLVHDTAGPSALARFDRDVLAQSGVKYLIILEGINDIGHTFHPRAPNENEGITVDDLIVAMKQMIARAHERGILVYGATLTPWDKAGPEGASYIAKLNDWIRVGGMFDGVIDFNAALRDPDNPAGLLKAYDSGDHIHPSDAGYKTMGGAIALKLFKR
jgi:lysophospholipase L1-like esterase